MLLARACALLGALAAGLLLASAAPAHAHSFLASTDPVHGARLAEAPEDVALQFSEAVAAGSVTLTVRRSGGGGLVIPDPGLESGAAVVRQPLPGLGAGVYVVWQVSSAVDGHQSAGEFAFAVGGAADADLPASAAQLPGVDRPSAAATWLFFTGVAVAVGGLAGPALLGAAGGSPGRWRPGWLHAGVWVALAGVAARMAREGVLAAAATFSGFALLAVAVLLVLALLAARLAVMLPGRRVVAWEAPASAALLAGALVAWSARSHGAAADGVLGWVLDAVHLAAAALWTGALGYVVAALWGRRGEDRRALVAAVARYAQVAAVLVAVVAATGVAQAFRLLPGVPALWSTGYGRVITVKSALLVAALAAAAAARSRALPRARTRLLRGLTSGEAAVLAVILAAAAVLVNAAPPQPASAEVSLLGPPPIEGPVVHDMGLAGVLTVRVMAGADRLDVEVLGTSGGIDGARVDVAVRYPNGTAAELHPRPCGAGCYTQQLWLPAGRTELHVTARAPGWTGGTMTALLRWPPPPAQPQRFDRMLAAMRAVSELRVAESVYSGHGVDPGAPDGPGVRITGEEFVSLMPWANGGVVDVRARAGDPGTFSFYLPGSSMFFTVRVDEWGRLVEQDMVNRGHEIDYRFAYPTGQPPRSYDR